MGGGGGGGRVRARAARFWLCARARKGALQLCAHLAPPHGAAQVFNVCTSPVVQQAWDSGQNVAVHGLVYSVEDGLLKARHWFGRAALLL